MQEIAGKRRRFGYRRIGVLLERKGMIMTLSPGNTCLHV
ncbi:Mobile element protein [Roseibacterium elongatum DSM 19469]|uniref:Mobile element protein n=1 Tax=Roseicyclus elongatus DSM 19469 TaxID=1294273 RepID=W8SA55_9RHOB|nr:Mobile element protein [Roseibacterium elongatum DSM 19469]